ncbi:probable calcium-binding protein CML23 [Prosopis cineraria]|uniref:probable calcium-binding protein CML23 n=1 Tax=Prosopis cineraria TaxID=364024 RepID=UPI002410734E|nr:probable calcium-binding protein CML23 [Prosopis cineraria]
MFDPFTTCFTFLLHHNPIDRQTRSRQPRRSSSFFSSNSFSRDDHNGKEAIVSVSNQFKQVFKLIDANGDGKISASELSHVLACLENAEKKKKKKKKKKKELAEKEAEGIVKVLDFNGDGFVDLDEFMMVVMKEEEEDAEEEEGELRDAFLIYDSDRNGLISAKELRRVMLSLGWRDCSVGDCKKMIGAVDLNGDGFVDFHEFRSMMRSSSVTVLSNRHH